MEKEILKKLNFDMKHPKPTDFLERFSKAAKVRAPVRNASSQCQPFRVSPETRDGSTAEGSAQGALPWLARMCALCWVLPRH